jgi:prolipoprotein diacylglyceryltransferase
VEFPVLIGPLHAHTVFETLGYALGFQTYRALKRRAGDPVDAISRWAVIAAAAVGAALGSKVLYLLEDPARTWERRGDVAFLLGGKTIVGGILGAWLAVEFVKRRLGVVRRTGDLFAAPLLLGIAVGRIGCFCEGIADHTYGVATSLPWGVDFGDGVRRHPTQIYEILFIAAVLPWFLRATLRREERGLREGDVFRAAVAVYFAWRFLVDFIKPRPDGLPVSGIQAACLVTVILVALSWHRERRVRTSPT